MTVIYVYFTIHVCIQAYSKWKIMQLNHTAADLNSTQHHRQFGYITGYDFLMFLYILL